MRDLIKYLEIERDSATGKARVIFQDWINQLETRHPVRKKLFAQQKSDKRSKTGVACISKFRSGNDVDYWRVGYYKEGSRTLKYFNSRKHGEQNAWDMAIKFLRLVNGKVIVYDEAKFPYPVKGKYELAA